MNLLAVIVPGIAELPPPPIPGDGGGSDAWWRVIGVVIVSLITIALFLYIFRPLTPTPAEGVDERQREDEELARLAAQLGAASGEEAQPTAVIPFRTRAAPAAAVEQTEVSNAAARLRRILGQAEDGGDAGGVERPRLGARRTDGGSAADTTTQMTEPPAKGPSELSAQLPSSSAERRGEPEQTRVEENEEVFGEPAADILGDLGDIAQQLPSDLDRQVAATPLSGSDIESDLLSQLVDRQPSDADQSATTTTESEPPIPPVLSGGVPTEHDLTRLATTSQGSGKIVPFVLRQPARPDSAEQAARSRADESQKPAEEAGSVGSSAQVLPIPVDTATRDAIEAVIRQLLFFANVGEVLQGFGLYSDEHLRRFMADSGMPEEEFRALFAAVPPKQPEEWTRIEFISRVVRMADGRISADVRYVDGHHPNGSERLTFVQDPSTRRWLIDDIQAI